MNSLKSAAKLEEALRTAHKILQKNIYILARLVVLVGTLAKMWYFFVTSCTKQKEMPPLFSVDADMISPQSTHLSTLSSVPF